MTGKIREFIPEDVGAEATPPSVGIVLGAEVLMRSPLPLPNLSESDGALRD